MFLVLRRRCKAICFAVNSFFGAGAGAALFVLLALRCDHWWFDHLFWHRSELPLLTCGSCRNKIDIQWLSKQKDQENLQGGEMSGAGDEVDI